MLKTRLQHPGLLHRLARLGHGSRMLISDGNYPFETKCGPQCETIWLNVAPGLVSTLDVLELLTGIIPFEAAAVMVPEQEQEPSIFSDFRRLLPGLALEPFDRFAFYEEAMGPHVALQVATGETRLFANILLTIGVVEPVRQA